MRQSLPTKKFRTGKIILFYKIFTNLNVIYIIKMIYVLIFVKIGFSL
jgi:hypothetical protein